ncbi:hypothetical protein [Jiangella alba]|uniref:hypothetical protein n=1 Tax=Jiangella alba TaxID=561176 RepID=UPI00114CFDD0|nr:hypothetical protein [Jiangella alba]
MSVTERADESTPGVGRRGGGVVVTAPGRIRCLTTSRARAAGPPIVRSRPANRRTPREPAHARPTGGQDPFRGHKRRFPGRQPVSGAAKVLACLHVPGNDGHFVAQRVASQPGHGPRRATVTVERRATVTVERRARATDAPRHGDGGIAPP